MKCWNWHASCIYYCCKQLCGTIPISNCDFGAGQQTQNKILLRPKVEINKYFQLDSQSQVLLQVLIKFGMKLIHFASTKVKQNSPQN